jgi:hypothetical protein
MNKWKRNRNRTGDPADDEDHDEQEWMMKTLKMNLNAEVRGAFY